MEVEIESSIFSGSAMIIFCAVFFCIALIHGVAMWLKKCKMDRFQKYGYGECRAVAPPPP